MSPQSCREALAGLLSYIDAKPPVNGYQQVTFSTTTPELLWAREALAAAKTKVGAR